MPLPKKSRVALQNLASDGGDAGDVETVNAYAVQQAGVLAENIAGLNELHLDASQDLQFGKRVLQEDGTYDITWDSGPYNVVKATVRKDNPDPSAPDAKLRLVFAPIYGEKTTSITASATAYIAPRDVVAVLDYSGSMGYDTGFRSSAVNSFGLAAVESGLDDIWTALSTSEAAFSDAPNVEKFPSNGFGKINSSSGGYYSGQDLNSIFSHLELGSAPSGVASYTRPETLLFSRFNEVYMRNNNGNHGGNNNGNHGGNNNGNHGGNNNGNHGGNNNGNHGGNNNGNHGGNNNGNHGGNNNGNHGGNNNGNHGGNNNGNHGGNNNGNHGGNNNGNHGGNNNGGGSTGGGSTGGGSTGPTLDYVPFPQEGRNSNGTLKGLPSKSESEQLWKDYIKWVRDNSLYGYNRKYNYRTLSAYFVQQRASNSKSEDLWRAPIYPFHAMKEGMSMFSEFLGSLGFGDQLGLSIYATTARRETGLWNDSGFVQVDLGDEHLTTTYSDIDTIQRHKQPAHYDSTTNIGDGILEARELLDEQARDGVIPTLIVMTDGNANQSPSGFSLPGGWDWNELTDYDGDGSANYWTSNKDKQWAFYQAKLAIDHGYTIHTMAVGAGADRNLMRAIAFAGNGRFYRRSRRNECCPDARPTGDRVRHARWERSTRQAIDNFGLNQLINIHRQ